MMKMDMELIQLRRYVGRLIYSSDPIVKNRDKIIAVILKHFSEVKNEKN